MRVFRRLAALAAVLVFAQIVLGAVVRLTGSGLACPDWPLCYGLWFPTPGKLAALPQVDYGFWQVMAEWAHRFNAAAFVGPAVAALAVVGWRVRRQAPALLRLSAFALVLVLAQAALGGFTVLDRNSPWSVAAHLALALALLALLVHARIRAVPGAAPRQGGGLAAAAAAFAVAAAASGAMTAKAGATLACPGWPLCGGASPAFEDPLTRLHVAHRAFAAAAAALVVAVWWRTRRGAAAVRRLAGPAALAVAAQVALGVLVLRVFAGGALWPQVLVGAVHQAVAVGVFACLAAVASLQATAAPGRG